MFYGLLTGSLIVFFEPQIILSIQRFVIVVSQKYVPFRVKLTNILCVFFFNVVKSYLVPILCINEPVKCLALLPLSICTFKIGIDSLLMYTATTIYRVYSYILKFNLFYHFIFVLVPNRCKQTGKRSKQG